METTHKTLTVLRCKLVIVGDAKVGKTALAQMFHSGGHNFPKNYVMTIGVDFTVKVVSIPETSTNVELYMFDSAGQSIFNQLEHGDAKWADASFVMLVFDVSNRQSLQSCSKWLAKVQRQADGRRVPGVLVANKTDLWEQGRGEVTSEQGRAFAEQQGLAYFETSAAKGEEANDAPFNHVAQEFYKRYEEHLTRAEQACM
jgi:transport family protein 27